MAKSGKLIQYLEEPGKEKCIRSVSMILSTPWFMNIAQIHRDRIQALHPEGLRVAIGKRNSEQGLEDGKLAHLIRGGAGL